MAVDSYVAVLSSVLFALVGALVGILGGFLLGRLGLNHLRHETARLTADLTRSEAHAREQTRLLGRLQSENATVAGLIRQLPSVVRELNRSDLDATRIPQMLFQLTQNIFGPEQILLYLAPSAGDTDKPVTELHLREHWGIVEIPHCVRCIRVGEGKIGWAAENKVDMLAEQWLNLSRTEGHSIPDNHPSLRLDMIGPMLHYDENGPHLLGVLCVGNAPGQNRSRDEKLLLQMITNLGSIALMNTRRVNALKARANHDGLTGLLNKRQFQHDAGNMIHEAELKNVPVGFFIFDIDHFKTYNDTNGHLAGDELLKNIAQVMRAAIRSGDIVARYGGEEFVVAMPGADGETAMAVAEKVRQAVESHPFEFGHKQPGGRLTISGGVAVFPQDGTQSNQLIAGADEALYRAKKGGRNRVCAHRTVQLGDYSGTELPDPLAIER